MFPFSAAYFLWTVLNNEGGKQRDIIGNKGPLQQIFEILLKACPCTVVINYFQKRYLRNLLPRFPRVFVSFYTRGAQLVKKNRPALQYRSLFNQMQIITYSVVGKWAHCETNTQRVNNDVVSNEAGIQNPKLPTIWMDFGFDVVKEWTNLRLSFGNDINVSNRKDNECEYDLNEGKKFFQEQNDHSDACRSIFEREEKVMSQSPKINKHVHITHAEWAFPHSFIHHGVLIASVWIPVNYTPKSNEFSQHSVLCII